MPPANHTLPHTRSAIYSARGPVYGWPTSTHSRTRKVYGWPHSRNSRGTTRMVGHSALAIPLPRRPTWMSPDGHLLLLCGNVWLMGWRCRRFGCSPPTASSTSTTGPHRPPTLIHAREYSRIVCAGGGTCYRLMTSNRACPLFLRKTLGGLGERALREAQCLWPQQHAVGQAAHPWACLQVHAPRALQGRCFVHGLS